MHEEFSPVKIALGVKKQVAVREVWSVWAMWSIRQAGAGFLLGLRPLHPFYNGDISSRKVLTKQPPNKEFLFLTSLQSETLSTLMCV